MKNKIGSSRGYSLVEILVVIAIVGVMSLITIPAFINFSQQGRLRAAVRQIHGDLRTMRMLAITNNIRIRTELQPDNVSYNFYSSTDNGATWAAYIPKGQISSTKSISSPVTFGATTFLDVNGNNKPDIVFLPSGMLDPNCASAASNPTLVLSVPWQNIYQNIMTITVSPAGGISTVGSHS
jgi:prepilin-type N-terminal cleavage/methylation domain-containing protein